MAFVSDFSLRIMFSRFIHVVAYIIILLPVMAEYILLYECTTFWLSTHQLMDIWVVPIFWVLIILWTLVYKFLFEYVFSVLLDIYLGRELLGHMVTVFSFLSNCQTVFQGNGMFYIPTSNVWGFHFSPHPCQHLLLFIFLIIAILADVKWCLL